MKQCGTRPGTQFSEELSDRQGSLACTVLSQASESPNLLDGLEPPVNGMGSLSHPRCCLVRTAGTALGVGSDRYLMGALVQGAGDVGAVLALPFIGYLS